MRTFLAIPLPKETKDLLSRIQEQLKTSKADVKWVEPQNIHLTLKFLGEINEEQLNKISAIVEETAKNFAPFTVGINSIGAFPRITAARVIWAGIDKGDAEVKKIAADLEEKIALIGIPKEERPFSTHITIGRTRSGLNLDKLAKALQGMSVLTAEYRQEFAVNRITLFRSTLSAHGPVYAPLKEAALRTT